MARTNVSAADFAECVKRVADADGSLADIASELGLKVGSVATKLSGWRKKGIAVPNFARGGNGGAKLDVAGLSAIFEG
jgi:hypothetical protein